MSTEPDWKTIAALPVDERREMATKDVRTLKHGRGVVHELDCPWLNGPRATTDWSKYEIVSAKTVQDKRHCGYC
jgi:hypothetical protein